MAVGVRQAPRGQLGASPVQSYTYIHNVRKTHRLLRTAHLRARTPTKNSLHPKGNTLRASYLH